jgi:hypothetical protein
MALRLERGWAPQMSAHVLVRAWGYRLAYSALALDFVSLELWLAPENESELQSATASA